MCLWYNSIGDYAVVPFFFGGFMYVYLLFHEIPYEGADFLGVFKSFDGAFVEMKRQLAENSWGKYYKLSEDLHSAVYDDLEYKIIKKWVQ